jgi:hypothetical protein
MRASPFEILLANLRQEMPDPVHKMSREEAYEELKRYTGQDFGFDVKLWEEWGFWDNMFTNPPFFLKYLSH